MNAPVQVAKQPHATSPWPRRLAWATVGATVPLLLLGGTVTTLRVGMAVPDWPTTFEQNMFAYPLSAMLENTGVFWEHTHRLWGALVGFLVLSTFVAVQWKERRGTPRVLAAFALLGVIGQGLLGGLRVLENSPQLAFLHGSLAQAVFALFVALAITLSVRWIQAEARPCKRTRGLRRWALATVVVVYGQIVLGAWLRHTGLHALLGAHIVLAGAVIVCVVKARSWLVASHADGVAGGHDRSVLQRGAKRLVTLLVLQIAIGIAATVAIFVVSSDAGAPITVGEQVFATLHVLVGALLLASSLSAAMWSHHLVTVGGSRQAAVQPSTSAVGHGRSA